MLLGVALCLNNALLNTTAGYPRNAIERTIEAAAVKVCHAKIGNRREIGTKALIVMDVELGDRCVLGKATCYRQRHCSLATQLVRRKWKLSQTVHLTSTPFLTPSS